MGIEVYVVDYFRKIVEFSVKVLRTDGRKCIVLFYLEFRSKKSPSKLGDFGLVNIVQEATPNLPEDQPIISSIQPHEPATTTEQTSPMLDDIRK